MHMFRKGWYKSHTIFMDFTGRVPDEGDKGDIKLLADRLVLFSFMIRFFHVINNVIVQQCLLAVNLPFLNIRSKNDIQQKHITILNN